MTSYTVLADREVDEAAWLAARDGLYTATDIGRIMTGGPGAWATLKREKAHGSTFRGNAYTEHGNAREPHIVRYLATLDGYGLEPNSALLGSTAVPKYAATPDAIGTDGETLGEVKTTVHDWPTVDDIPRRYWWQVQWQMLVTGATRTVFAFELHENFVPCWMAPRYFVLDRDDDAIADAVATLDEFIEFDPDGVDAPDGLDELLSELDTLESAAAVVTDRVAAKRAEIESLVRDHGKPIKFEGTARNISWSGKPGKRSSIDTAALKKAHPELATEFTKTTETKPRLTITARS